MIAQARMAAWGRLTRTHRGAIFVGVLGIICALSRVGLAAERYSADAIKAAYLYRFAGYVQWPGRQQPGSPFTIDVIGDTGVARELQRLLPDHPINGHPAGVQIIHRMDELGPAQMLYLGSGYTGDVRTALASIAGRPVLVVTDEGHGLDDGSMINFVETDERVRFEVSLTAAGRAGLNISSELLSVAARVQGGHFQSSAGCGSKLPHSEDEIECPRRLAALATKSRPAPR